MDFRTPCQIILGFLLAATALSVLGLAADNASYIDHHRNDSPVNVHYTRWNQAAQAQYSYWVTMEYLPSHLDMGTTYATLVAGIVCSLVGFGVVVGSWTMRGKKLAGTPSKSSLPLPSTVLGLATVAFIASLTVAIYVWHAAMDWPTTFQAYLPVAQGTSAGPITYDSPFTFTPEAWNCLVSQYIVQPAQGRELQGLCREAAVARYLMLPMLILSAALLFCLLRTWHKARRHTASGADDVGGKAAEEISVQGKE